jgi:FAD/FMN-containing dehydrogenase
VIVIGFDDFNERARQKKLKKVHKLLSKIEAFVESADGEDSHGLLAVREVTAYACMPTARETTAPPLVDGAYVPRARFEDFTTAVATLAAKYHVSLPLHLRTLENTLYTRPTLQLKKVGDKQKIFKLLDEYSDLVHQHGGHLIGEDGEGRVKARYAHQVLDPEVLELFAQVKTIFDPYGILNPGVKQVVELRQLVSRLRADYDVVRYPEYVPHT